VSISAVRELLQTYNHLSTEKDREASKRSIRESVFRFLNEEIYSEFTLEEKQIVCLMDQEMIGSLSVDLSLICARVFPGFTPDVLQEIEKMPRTCAHIRLENLLVQEMKKSIANKISGSLLAVNFTTKVHRLFLRLGLCIVDSEYNAERRDRILDLVSSIKELNEEIEVLPLNKEIV
jgi:hypothetical protein